MNPNVQFYFLLDSYFEDFPDERLMKNKAAEGSKPHARPCFFAFQDKENPDIFWVVPVSSKIEKYKKKETREKSRYGRCISVCFGKLLGRDTAFLTQNICPTKSRYMVPYLDKNGNPVVIDGKLAQRITKNARAVLRFEKRGIRVAYPDIMKIYNRLDAE